MDYVLVVHQNSSTGIGRFGREFRGSPDAIPDVISIQRVSQIVRECESPFSAEVNFPKVALLSSIGFGLSMT